ncbi:MAG TPA: (2Fe-2S) ferredoxin domain-containing protein [Bacillota bacterium]|nr:(2Fe-2S) ferredoxin domain-containing protein [Bacillota bacterium]HPT87443.1 (2Fe-2S) ferredoxin domain-containing protein [Bacillota bacterium]
MLVLEVCVGSSCHLKGAYDVITELQQLIATHGLQEHIELKACFCMNNCIEGVNVRWEGQIYPLLSKENIVAFFTDRVLCKFH